MKHLHTHYYADKGTVCKEALLNLCHKEERQGQREGEGAGHYQAQDSKHKAEIQCKIVHIMDSVKPLYLRISPLIRWSTIYSPSYKEYNPTKLPLNKGIPFLNSSSTTEGRTNMQYTHSIAQTILTKSDYEESHPNHCSHAYPSEGGSSTHLKDTLYH